MIELAIVGTLQYTTLANISSQDYLWNTRYHNLSRTMRQPSDKFLLELHQ